MSSSHREGISGIPGQDEPDSGARGGTSAHTPGPWVYRTGGTFDWGWVTNADGLFIAQAKDPLANASFEAHRAAKTDPWEANARLIAAAPDLLAGAREIHRLMLVIESAVRFADPGYQAEVLEALRENHAAVAKALGAATASPAVPIVPAREAKNPTLPTPLGPAEEVKP